LKRAWLIAFGKLTLCGAVSASEFASLYHLWLMANDDAAEE
jgi:hypothetical protein